VLKAGVAGAGGLTAAGAGYVQWGCWSGGDGEQPLDVERAADGIDPAPTESYTAGDGRELVYRAYEATTATTQVLVLHGSSADSRYLAPLARGLADRDVAHVATPDIRGHGRTPERRGDVADVERPQTDIVDLVQHLDSRWQADRTVLVGHSSGGGLAVRFGGGPHAEVADGYVLLAPYLGHDAPTTREASGGWVQTNVCKIILLQLLEGFGTDALSGSTVVRFNVPQSQRDEYTTPAYSYRMMRALRPRDWQSDLEATDEPVIVLVGRDDQSMNPAAYEKHVAEHVRDVHLLRDTAHLDIVRKSRTADRIATFLRSLS
jgi:alpha-beta hydrolase superfamily lysophospholipase